jgi:hypothetical protein
MCWCLMLYVFLIYVKIERFHRQIDFLHNFLVYLKVELYMSQRENVFRPSFSFFFLAIMCINMLCEAITWKKILLIHHSVDMFLILMVKLCKQTCVSCEGLSVVKDSLDYLTHRSDLSRSDLYLKYLSLHSKLGVWKFLRC